MQHYSRGFILAKGLLLSGLCAGLLPSFFSWNKLMLARDGAAQYTVVQSDKATEPEKYAVTELTNFLGRVTGAAFPVVAESACPKGARGIYVGWTAYAEQNGIDAARLGEEEWVIRSIGKNLVLAGGRPRGTLYAVYEFLERQVGCHWLASDTEVIPSKPALALDKLDIRGKPWFWKRVVGSPTGVGDDQWKFMVRNKYYRQESYLIGHKDFGPKDAFYQMEGSPRAGHSFSYFVNASNWFGSHPEYFSLEASGKRLPAYDGAGPGQLCLTHPDVRRLTKAKLREYIARDRAEAAQKGSPPPRIYKIGQNDKYDTHCKCTNCQAIALREGGESGPLIDFINAVAEDIEKDYPDILVETYAYNLTQKPPKTIKPRHNVIIGWCDVYSSSDLVRPLNHPYNADHYAEIQGWGKIAPHLAIGDDYWVLYGYYAHFPAPYCMIQSLGPDLKLFADCRVETFYAESPDYIEAGENFTRLKFWLAYQLLINPYQPVEPLIKMFMDGYYGAASSRMNDYLKYLEDRIDKEAEFMMVRDAPYNLKYLDLNFFMTAEKMFDEAQALVKPGSREALHVQRERFIVDGALLFLWPWLDRKLAANEQMPFDRETAIRRYETNGLAYIKVQYSRIYSPSSKEYYKDGRFLQKMAALFRDPKLPEPFRSMPARDVADFNWLTFSQVRHVFVDDKEAAGEMAVKFTSVPDAIRAAEKITQPLAEGDDVLKKPLSFGVTDGATIALKPEEIPQDGKYHVYKIGRVNVKKETTVWALEGKRLGVNVDRLFVTNAADRAANDWTAYISLKVQGPAYVKGAAGTNEVWMDRVLLVKPQPGEKPDAAELQRQAEQKKLDARRPQVRVKQAPKGAAGDPLKVDWAKAAKAGAWSKLKGAATARKVDARFAQDGEYLYIRLTEELDPKALVNNSGIFGGDDWELLLAARRGAQPYRQIGINPKGDHTELAYGESSSKWDSGVKVISETGAAEWTVSMAFPLDRLLPGGVKPGQSVYANILRGGKDPLAWSPVFEDNFHSLDRLGEIVLEYGPKAAV